MSRRKLTFKIKLASALLQMVRYDDDEAEFVRIIPYEDAKLMTADQIISLFNFDHYPILFVNGGPDEPWNLVPRMIAAHRRKTARTDRPAIAKAVRIDKDTAEFRARLLAKDRGERAPQRSSIKSRGFDKGRRPIRNRSSFA